MKCDNTGGKRTIFGPPALPRVLNPSHQRKPRPGRDRVDICPLPNSQYSIGLWPVSLHASKNCMDSVNSETREAVNSPVEFEHCGMPNPETHWWALPSARLRSLKRHFGIQQHKIRPGEEKWVLRDGQTCVLKPPGEMDVQSTVPTRRRPTLQYNVHILDFPKTI
ncbi:hypothetical protein BD413DRAFT_614185 [Trametes elegans]|nr:hypothetical protein BD413DRAFT_614185 [Trametes elegans]